MTSIPVRVAAYDLRGRDAWRAMMRRIQHRELDDCATGRNAVEEPGSR